MEVGFIFEKKLGSFLLALMFVFSFVMFAPVSGVFAVGTAHYVSSSSGNDNNDGTSSSTPWGTLAKASTITYQKGDQLLLKCGDTGIGE